MNRVVWLRMPRKAARLRPLQDWRDLTVRPFPGMAAMGIGDQAISQVFMESDDGLPIPAPPAELLVDEPLDSPIFRPFAWNEGALLRGLKACAASSGSSAPPTRRGSRTA